MGHRARVVDLGCGEGRDSVFLAEQGHEVVGVDLSLEGLKKAQHLAERRGVECEVRIERAGFLPERGHHEPRIARGSRKQPHPYRVRGGAHREVQRDLVLAPQRRVRAVADDADHGER